MKCPRCNADTAVTDSRDRKRPGVYRWRRRKCVECGHKFSTMEIAIAEPEQPTETEGDTER